MGTQLTRKEAAKLRQINKKARQGRATVSELKYGMALKRRNNAYFRSLKETQMEVEGENLDG